MLMSFVHLKDICMLLEEFKGVMEVCKLYRILAQTYYLLLTELFCV